MLARNPKIQLQGLASKAGEVAALLKELANEKRLLILCALLAQGESTVASLAQTANLGQSALSQHLARLRDKGLVSFRREGATLFYSVADAKITQVLKTLKTHYC
jgi:ArsR family transcriptional regulator, virulence genes transcriptional regulator